MAKEKSEEFSDDFELVDEENESAPEIKAAGDVLKKLREKLKECQKEKQEYLDGWQRAKADLINERRDAEKRQGEFVKFANEGLVMQILPVVDSFEMAMKEKVWEMADKNWREGMLNIYDQLTAILKDNAVEQFDPKGEVFNPARHDSIETVETGNENEDNVIAEVLQKGFTLHGRVIRPARVKVAQYKITNYE